MEEKYEPRRTEVDRTSSVTIEFHDGHVARFDLMTLRLGCPCATCRALRDGGQAAWPRPGSPQPLAITSANLHGAWALNITWNDGHATGIFPFESLRRWSEGEIPFPRDSGLGPPKP